MDKSESKEEQIVTEPIQPLETNQDDENTQESIQQSEEVKSHPSEEVKVEAKPEDPEDYEELEVEEFFVKYKNLYV